MLNKQTIMLRNTNNVPQVRALAPVGFYFSAKAAVIKRTPTLNDSNVVKPLAFVALQLHTQ